MSSNTRRSFLAAGALLPAALAAPSTPRPLGRGPNALQVNFGQGLGCMGMSWHRSFVPDRARMLTLLRQAYDLGVNLFDTAEAYGPFVNEELVGEAIAPFRKNIILCSKFGFEFQNGRMTGAFNSRPAHIREVVDQSLRRLRTDYLDLLYQHRVDPAVPMEDVAGTVKDLIAAGKVRRFGLSEAGPDSIRRAHAVQPVSALQSEFSILTRDPLQDVIPLCEQLGITFVPYSPLSRAYLTGYINERTTYVPGNDNRPTLPRYTPAAVVANWKILDALKVFGDRRGLTIAQVAIAWLQAQKPFILPIPGTTKLAHLQENLAASSFTFAPAELAALTAELEALPIAGARYPTPQTR